MTKYNFDQIIDRKNTGANKVDKLKTLYGSSDLIPLWVADMDFISPQPIIDAIIERTKHGIFGYTHPSNEYYSSIIGWLDTKHNWDIKKEWLSFVPGIVKGIAFVIDCFVEKDQKIIIQPPVYHPFRIIPTLHQREVVDNPLILKAGKYVMDFDDLKQVIDPKCKLLILCNPHNPGGRVWTKEELEIIATVCYDNNILVISDEIHCDLVFEPLKHIPFATVSEKAAQNSITFMAPSKTFNIAGIVSSFAIVPNEKIRKDFFDYLNKSELESSHIFAYTATEAAYSHGEEWLIQVKEYIQGNIQFVDEYLKENIPQIKVMMPEASYLIWLDCRELNLSQKELISLFVDKAHLALNNGTIFGQGGEGFMRLNVGSPRSIIEKAMDNLKSAVENQ